MIIVVGPGETLSRALADTFGDVAVIDGDAAVDEILWHWSDPRRRRRAFHESVNPVSGGYRRLLC
ncbi:hypothetical protein GGC64_003419 [Mycobacterium sp. OAS707]|uniref:hypothetical protein n=1 Tax=Mycobacterium sp. OAS707 TaxID=2663822 RepID=UPI00178A3D7C|nr:hypothetical protein [Mycobacterium sp. OAS707]MBE1549395.1 hypothetical protein [Mycobacterium sp. OAS707]